MKNKNYTIEIEYTNDSESWNNLVDNIISFIIKDELIGGFIGEK
ncbi:hypothetical protein P5E48_11535 [Clostridium perfringens]|nr:hypothetical protein [Clostridium perfringens]MDK0793862.1 hypothetical protein [Clostridium perfringens]